MTTALAGFGILLRAALRHNAVSLAPWIVLISAVPIASRIAYDDVFPTLLQRLVLSRSVAANPAFSLLFGPPLDLMTADGFAVWRSLAFGSFFAGLMAILVVVRETRAREDSGVAELVLAAPVGRFTQLAVALAVAWVASIVLGTVVGGALIAFGGEPRASVLLGACFATAGGMFASVAAVTSQFASYAGRAIALATATLGATFLLRGLADSSAAIGWLSWLTPFGWLQRVAPTAANDARPLALCLAFAVLGGAAAAFLSIRRDFGQGVLPVTPGPARANWTRGLAGLALRLHREAALAWGATFVLLGLVLGFVVSSLGDVVTGNAQILAMLAAYGADIDVTFMVVALLLNVLTVLAAVQGVGVVMVLAAEEGRTRVDPLLATATRRSRLLASHVRIALLAPTVGMLLSATAVAATARLAGSEVAPLQVIWQALLCLAAAWVLIALAVALVGALPGLRSLAWIAVALTFVLSLFGPQLGLWDWVLALSPIQHVPNLATGSVSMRPVAWLGAASVVLLAIGFFGFARRDISTG